MGWTPPLRVYRIEPDTGPYAGFQVKISSVPMGQFFSLASLSDQLDGEDLKGKSINEALGLFGEVRQMFESLAESMIEWNVELPPVGKPNDPVKPVSCDISGLNRLDLDFVMWIFEQWLNAMGALPDGPLGAKQSPMDNLPPEVSGGQLVDLSRSLSPVPN